MPSHSVFERSAGAAGQLQRFLFRREVGPPGSELRPRAVRVLMLAVCDRLPCPAFSREGHLLKAKEEKVPRSEPERRQFLVKQLGPRRLARDFGTLDCRKT